jgi:hypothetical protein
LIVSFLSERSDEEKPSTWLTLDPNADLYSAKICLCNFLVQFQGAQARSSFTSNVAKTQNFDYHWDRHVVPLNHRNIAQKDSSTEVARFSQQTNESSHLLPRRNGVFDHFKLIFSGLETAFAL